MVKTMIYNVGTEVGVNIPDDNIKSIINLRMNIDGKDGGIILVDEICQRINLDNVGMKILGNIPIWIILGQRLEIGGVSNLQLW